MRFRLSAALVAVMLTIGCAGKAPSSLSPVGVRSWEANQAVLTLGQVQKTAIGLNAIQKCSPAPVVCAPLLSNANTGIVVDAVAASVKSIQQAPAGWRSSTTVALAEIRSRLDAGGKANLSAWLGVVDTFLQETH